MKILKRVFLGLGLTLTGLVLAAGWGHWSFYLWTPAVATTAAIEEQYGEMLAICASTGTRSPWRVG